MAIPMSASISGNDPYTAWMKSACPGPAPPTPMTPGRWAAADRTAETVAPPAALLGSPPGPTRASRLPPEGELAQPAEQGL